jgi:hypothetical protein
MVFGKSMSDKLLKKRALVAKMHGRFLIGNFIIGIDCDTPWAKGKLISAEVPPALAKTGVAVLPAC